MSLVTELDMAVTVSTVEELKQLMADKADWEGHPLSTEEILGVFDEVDAAAGDILPSTFGNVGIIAKAYDEMHACHILIAIQTDRDDVPHDDSNEEVDEKKDYEEDISNDARRTAIRDLGKIMTDETFVFIRYDPGVSLKSEYSTLTIAFDYSDIIIDLWCKHRTKTIGYHILKNHHTAESVIFDQIHLTMKHLPIATLTGFVEALKNLFKD
jgi:hypothetical protein